MTITNFSATVLNGVCTCAWDSTLEYSFLYQDAELVFSAPSGIKNFSLPFVDGAIYQAVDSATASPALPPSEAVPFRYITLNWDNDPEAIKYEVDIDGGKTYYTANATSYTHKSNRLAGGEHTFKITGIDIAGNRSIIKSLTYYIETPPTAVQGLVLTQSAATNITATIIPPTGW